MMREAYIEVVEQATGRKMRTFLSRNHIGPDLAAEIFVLESQPDEVSDVSSDWPSGLRLTASSRQT